MGFIDKEEKKQSCSKHAVALQGFFLTYTACIIIGFKENKGLNRERKRKRNKESKRGKRREERRSAKTAGFHFSVKLLCLQRSRSLCFPPCTYTLSRRQGVKKGEFLNALASRRTLPPSTSWHRDRQRELN